MNREQKKIYFAVIIVNVLFIIGFCLFIFMDRQISFRECWIYKYTGWYCPACGGTRAVKALLDGKIWESLRANSFVLYVLISDICYIIVMTVYRAKKKSFPYPKIGKILIGAGLLVLILNCVFHNLFGI